MGTSSSTLEIGNALNLLTQENVPILPASDVWKNIFKAKVSTHDMFLATQPDMIRKLRRDFPGNLSGLLFKCVEQIHAFTVSDQTKTPCPIACTNALLIITRIMPFIYEKKDWDETTQQVLQEGARKGNPHGRTNFAQKVLWENSLCNDAGTQFPLSGPVGKMLIQTLVAVCFIPGYTIGLNQKMSNECLERFPGVEYNLLWANGVGSSNTARLSSSEAIYGNRLVVVKAILSVLSEDCFEPRAVARGKMRSVLVDETMCPHSATFVASLLNTMTSYTPQGTFAYTSHWVGNQEELTLKVSQVLCLVFDSMNADVVQATKPAAPTSRPAASKHEEPKEPADDRNEEPVSGDDDEDEDEVLDASQGAGTRGQEEKVAEPTQVAPAAPSAPGEIENHAAWSLLDRCQREDFDGIFLGFYKLMNNHVSAKSAQLPGSQRSLAFMEEFVIILFKMLTKSPSFLNAFTVSPKTICFLIPMVDFAFDAIDDAAALSNIQIVVYMLMKLSACREFVLNCNIGLHHTYMPFGTKLVGGYVAGTYNDLVITAMATLMSCRKAWLVDLCEPAATVISNVSAFSTKISGPTASKLTDILVHFTKPNVLEAAGRTGAVILAAIVEACANMIQYQFAGCSDLVINILRCEKTLRELHEGLRTGKIQIAPDIGKRLHLYTLICTIEALLPQITNRLSADPNMDMYRFVKATTLVGALPVPHSIVVRQFLPRPQTETWVLAWLWGCIYMHAAPQFLDNRTVELFEMRMISNEPPAAGSSPAK